MKTSKTVLNVMISELVMKKVKAKASLLGLKIPDYVERVLEKNTEDMFIDNRIKKVVIKKEIENASTN